MCPPICTSINHDKCKNIYGRVSICQHYKNIIASLQQQNWKRNVPAHAKACWETLLGMAGEGRTVGENLLIAQHPLSDFKNLLPSTHKTQLKIPIDTMYKSATPLKLHMASLPGQ